MHPLFFLCLQYHRLLGRNTQKYTINVINDSHSQQKY